jgi:Fe-S-cluster-containing hydrogenase component 2
MENVFAPSRARIRIVKIDEEGIDIPTGCEHCDDAICILVCPVKAISRDEHGAVVINNDLCIGCKQCLVICPFGAIHYNSSRNLYYKCDLCNGDPECVKWCYTGAIKYIEPEFVVKDKRMDIAQKFLKMK